MSKFNGWKGIDGAQKQIVERTLIEHGNLRSRLKRKQITMTTANHAYRQLSKPLDNPLADGIHSRDAYARRSL